MLEYAFKESVWFPPELNIDAINEQLDRIRNISYREYLLFLQETPYIDAVYLIMNEGEKLSMTDCIRFVFHEDYVWDRKSEKPYYNYHVKCLPHAGARLCDAEEGRRKSNSREANSDLW